MAVDPGCLVEFIRFNIIETCLQAKAVSQLLAVQLHHTTAIAAMMLSLICIHDSTTVAQDYYSLTINTAFTTTSQ